MKEKRELPVKLSEREIDMKARECARNARRYRAVEEEKRERVREYSNELKEIRAAIDKTAAAVESGVENRLVECDVIVRGMQREVIRLDTDEVVQTSPLTPADIEQIEAEPGEDRAVGKRGKKGAHVEPPPTIN